MPRIVPTFETFKTQYLAENPGAEHSDVWSRYSSTYPTGVLPHDQVASACRLAKLGKITSEEVIQVLLVLLNQHFDNLGLSPEHRKAFLVGETPSELKKYHDLILRDHEIYEATELKARKWIEDASRMSRAFQIRYTDLIRTPSGKPAPLFASLVRREMKWNTIPAARVYDVDAEYKAPLREDGSRLNPAPRHWI